MTGDELFFFFLLLCFDDFLLEPDAAIMLLGFQMLGSFQKVPPRRFFRFRFWVFGALWRFASSGWVGSPCCVFSVFSPWFLGGRGGVFFFVTSCILHLSLLGVG